MLLPGTGLTLTSASAPHSVLVTIVVIFVAAVLLVGPSFLLLFSLHDRQLSKGNNMRKRADETRSRTLSPSLGSRSRPKIHNPMKVASRTNATIASIASGMNIHRATSYRTP